MSFDVPKAVEAVGKAAEEGFSFAKLSKQKQSETQIIKINKNLEKAVNIAEEIFLYMDNFKDRFSEEEWDEYIKLKRKFNKKD